MAEFFIPESIAIQSGRLMLARIHALSVAGVDFAFETTMASRSFVPFLKRCCEAGYQVNLLFLWLQDPELAVFRVADRVSSGGHSIPEEIIRRRYKRCLSNFFKLYIPLADHWYFYDNSNNHSALIAKKIDSSSIIIENQTLWNTLRRQYE